MLWKQSNLLHFCISTLTPDSKFKGLLFTNRKLQLHLHVSLKEMHAKNSHIFICKANIWNHIKQFWNPMLDINILGAEHKTPNEQENLNKKTYRGEKIMKIAVFIKVEQCISNYLCRSSLLICFQFIAHQYLCKIRVYF